MRKKVLFFRDSFGKLFVTYRLDEKDCFFLVSSESECHICGAKFYSDFDSFSTSYCNDRDWEFFIDVVESESLDFSHSTTLCSYCNYVKEKYASA